MTVALGRRMLTAVIAIALAFAPVGAASAAQVSSSQASMKPAAAHSQMHHDHAAMQAAMRDDHAAGHHCKKTGARSCCCDDKNSCAQTCLQKCFGQVAVMPPERASQRVLGYRIAPPHPAERPPGWSSAPQPPPPRA